MDFDGNISVKLRQILAKKGIWSMELSKMTNISYQTINNLLRGRNTSFKTVYTIAKVLEVSLDELDPGYTEDLAFHKIY